MAHDPHSRVSGSSVTPVAPFPRRWSMAPQWLRAWPVARKEGRIAAKGQGLIEALAEPGV